MIYEDLKGKKVLPGVEIKIGSATACLREPELSPPQKKEEY